MIHEKKLFKKLLISSLVYFTYNSIAYSDQDELMGLSVEDLLNVEVISVAKKAKSLNDSPAAIYVITQEDIKRIGATSVPEALRLAPGIDVARIDANKWAVSARGFNGRFANKLLVLIDGRNTYTRAFAGVYWESQDVMLEDVERIEVIRGPGATLWGANAVNGVINIITQHSADTQGGLVVAGGGTEELGFGAFRYGGRINSDTTARAYIKGFLKDENTHESGGSANDNWDKVQGGFRMDSQLTSHDNLTIQGDVYRSLISENTTVAQIAPPYQNTFNEDIKAFGGNFLVRQQHVFSSTSDYSIQFFYDFYEREESFVKESRHVIDLDFQYRFSLLKWNDIVWGAGYRYNNDDLTFNAERGSSINPTSRNDQLFSAFVQDELTLIDDVLWFTVGSKFEYNDYSGFEVQPTARLMWAAHHQHRFWTAASRAVRTPSRLEHDISLLSAVRPPTSSVIPASALFFEGNDQFHSEEVISFEVGYRTTVVDNVSIDVTAFYNDYNDLRSIQLSPLVVNPITGIFEISNIFVNEAEVQTYGLEVSAVWQALDWWRWDINYSLLRADFSGENTAFSTPRSPQQRVSLRSSMTPWKNMDLDILFRYVDRNKAIGFFGDELINAYVSMDVRLAWRPSNEIELSLVGQNLLAGQHLEYRQETLTSSTEIDRGMYGKVTWHF